MTYADRVTDRSKSTREQLEAQVREYFPREVETCEQFLEFAVDMMEADPWRGRPVKGSSDRIVAAEAARGLKTYRGSLDAALGGYAPQAAMLNRALFEAMVVCWWTCKNPELAGQRFEQHERHRLVLWNRRYMATNVIAEPPPGLPSKDEQRKLDKLFGPWGDRLWPGLPLHQLVDAIKDEWDQPELLKGYFAIAHAANNETHHTGASSVLRGVMRDDDAHLQIEAGPSLSGVGPALHGALWSYGHLLRAVANYFEVEGREQVEPMRMRCEAQFVPLDVLDVDQNPGRNDPCPCGSGKKFKKCHGA